MWGPQQIVLGLTGSIWPSHVGRDLAGAIVGLRQAFPTTTTNAGLLIGLPAIFLAGTKPVSLAVHTIDRQRCNTTIPRGYRDHQQKTFQFPRSVEFHYNAAPSRCLTDGAELRPA